MATLEQLEKALVAADKAGATDDARALAAEIRRVRGGAYAGNGQQPGSEHATSQPASRTTIGQDAAQMAVDLPAGAVRGAGSIGSTIIAAAEAARDLKRGRLPSLQADRERRAGMDAGLEALGADPHSLTFRGGKLGAEIAGTSGVGGLLARGVAGATGLSQSAPIINALRTGGMTLGPQMAAPGVAGTIGNALVRSAGGALTGAASAGLVNPEDAGMGALIGGGLPIATGIAGSIGRFAGGAMRRMAEPLSASNDEALLSDFLRKNLGARSGDAADNLRRATQAGPTMLPGYRPTAAEVAGVDSLAALQRTATAVDPVAMNQLGVIARGNQDVISGALDDLAGRGGARDFFAADRAAAGNDLYKAAFAVDPAQNLTPGLKGEITKLLKRPDIQDAKKIAKRLAENEGIKLQDGSVQGMHYMKLALDDMIGSAGQKGLGAAEKRALIGNRDRLVGLIENLAPEYREARSTYAAMSRPIDQMDTLERIATQATNARGNVTLAGIGRAATDKAAAGATGMRGATLEGTLDPQQIGRLNAIRSALEGVDFAQNAGRGVGSDTVQKLATANLVPGWATAMSKVPGMNALGGLAARGADAVYGAANARLSNKLANALLNPEDTLALLEFQRATNPLGLSNLLQNQQAQQLMYRSAPILADQ